MKAFCYTILTLYVYSAILEMLQFFSIFVLMQTFQPLFFLQNGWSILSILTKSILCIRQSLTIENALKLASKGITGTSIIIYSEISQTLPEGPVDWKNALTGLYVLMKGLIKFLWKEAFQQCFLSPEFFF